MSGAGNGNVETRSNPRIMLKSLLILVALMAPARTAQAAFVVNSTLDAHDASPADGVCRTAANVCTLRAAVEQASSAISGVIVVPAGNYTLTLGSLVVSSSITITGAGRESTIIDGNGQSGVIAVTGPLGVYNSLVLNGVTVQHGHSTSGAGIYVSSTALSPGSVRLTLNDVAVLANTSTDLGGGIYVTSSGISLNRTIVSGNSAAFGGGLYADTALCVPCLYILPVSLTDTAIAGNIGTNSCADTQLVGADIFDNTVLWDATIRRSTSITCVSLGTVEEPDRRSVLGRDHKAELGFYRPSAGTWYINDSSTNYTTYVSYQWGLSADIPVPGDYDGDGLTDIAVYRPATGSWYVLQSSSQYSTYVARQWGLSGDIPVPADYDGDGKTDIAVYRPATGYWYVLPSSTNSTTVLTRQWGTSTDIPVPGDYDGDGRADIAVYRPATGYWYVLQSSTNSTTFLARQWGASTDIPVAGDYDGDGRTDLAVRRPSSGYWYILQSSTNFTTYVAYPWGISSDVVLPSADFDGDGKADLALYRPSSQSWYVLLSGGQYATYIAQQFGQSTDVPIRFSQ
jgi:hypothetical protein